MKKIVFVEDDHDILEVARFAFEKAGYHIVLFQSAESLLASDELDPDLFILDMHLPDMDGLELCTILKEQEATCHIPVMMLSAEPKIKILAESVCADAVMEKPFELKELLSTISSLIADKSN